MKEIVSPISVSPYQEYFGFQMFTVVCFCIVVIVFT